MLTLPVSNSKFESGIIFEFDTETAIVEYNILNNISSGVQFNTRNLTVVSNCVIRKNLFSKLGIGGGVGTAGGIMIISEGTENAIITNLDIYNNTITVEPSKPPYHAIDLGSIDFGSGTGINIRNNIATGFADAWLTAGNSTNLRNVVVTHNDAWNNGNNNLPRFPGGNPTNYTYSNNISADPQFVSVPGNDYRLRAGSPCIDAGVNVGIPYLGSAPDMGYIEFGSGGPLPIKLLAFSVRENNGKNLLQWTTATENNSDHFNVQRSSDAQNWSTIGTVNASGFSTTEIRYSFTDGIPMKGMNYYRLAMIDKDAALEYSKIVSISARENTGLGITFIDISTGANTAILKINSIQAQSANLSIIDVSGRTVLNSGIQLQRGTNTITKNIPNLLQGIYYVKLFTADEVLVKNALTRN